jgi:hypothetical protein
MAALAQAQDGAAGNGGKARKLDAAPKGDAAAGVKPTALEQNPEIFYGTLMLTQRAKGNDDIQKLVDKAIADRKTMMKSEAARLDALEKVVAAARGDDQQALKAARETFKAASEQLRTDAKAVADDVVAIRTKMVELYPDLQQKAAERKAEKGALKNETRPAPNDVPPPVE